MSRYRQSGSWQSFGPSIRLMIGSFLVITVGYLGLTLASAMQILSLWPLAGFWAAVGWGSGRLGTRPVVALIVLGLVHDLTSDAPLGYWAISYLSVYLISNLFRKRALTDHSGLIRLTGDFAGFVAGFFIARTVMSLYLGTSDPLNILGGVLTAGLIYPLIRGVFQLTDDKRVG